MEERFATRMLAHGEISLGTIYGFADEERLGPEVGDRDEGAITLRKSGFTVVDSEVPGSVPPFLRNNVNLTQGSNVQIIARDGVSRRHEDPDCWAYSTTDRYNPEQMRRFGYDTCIEIFDIEPFFFAISRKLQHRARSFCGAAKCVYRDRAIEHTDYNQLPPAFVKAPRFAQQSKVRGLWIPRSPEPLSPIIVRAKKAVRFWRL